MDLIQKLARDINERLGSSAPSPETKASANRALEEIDEQLELLLARDAEEDFIISHLHRERARFQADSVEDLPAYIEADILREEPLCTCRNPDCDVKKARIPVAVQKSGTLQKGIRQYKQKHAGYPEALDAAAQEYRQTRARVHQQLRLVYAALGSDVTVEALSEPTAADSAADEPEPTSADD